LEGSDISNSTNPEKGAPLPQSRFSVILVEPQFRDNVGHVARSMLNFGVSDLIIVRGPPIDEATRARAVHAQAVLDHARHMPDLDAAAREFDHLVGFAARISKIDKAHLRLSEDLVKVAGRLSEMGGRVALVFGREDFGLSNEDVERCDILCTIPTSPAYRSMNLSHAVTVALYELHRDVAPKLPYQTMATPEEKEVLFTSWRHMTAVCGFQSHKQEQSLQMFRRVIGRAGITAWEYHRMMGVLSRSLKARGAWPPPGLGVGRYTEHLDDDAAGGPSS
jgi:TrmH family RNA methyltransferase